MSRNHENSSNSVEEERYFYSADRDRVGDLDYFPPGSESRDQVTNGIVIKDRNARMGHQSSNATVKEATSCINWQQKIKNESQENFSNFQQYHEQQKKNECAYDEVHAVDQGSSLLNAVESPGEKRRKKKKDDEPGEYYSAQLERQQQSEHVTKEEKATGRYQKRKKKNMQNSMKAEEIQGHRGLASVDELLNFIEQTENIKPNVNINLKVKKKKSSVSEKKLNIETSNSNCKHKNDSKLEKKLTDEPRNCDQAKEKKEAMSCLRESSLAEVEHTESVSEGEFQEIRRRRKKQPMHSKSQDAYSTRSASPLSQPSPIPQHSLSSYSFDAEFSGNFSSKSDTLVNDTGDAGSVAYEQDQGSMVSAGLVNWNEDPASDASIEVGTSCNTMSYAEIAAGMQENIMSFEYNLRESQYNDLNNQEDSVEAAESCGSKASSSESGIALDMERDYPIIMSSTAAKSSPYPLQGVALGLYTSSAVVEFLDGSGPSNIDIEFGFDAVSLGMPETVAQINQSTENNCRDIITDHLSPATLPTSEAFEQSLNNENLDYFRMSEIVAYIADKWKEVVSLKKSSPNKVRFYCELTS